MKWLNILATSFWPWSKDERTRVWHTMETAPSKGRILLWNHEVGVWSSECDKGEWPLFQRHGKTGCWYPRPYCWRDLPEGPKVDEWSLPVVAERKR